MPLKQSEPIILPPVAQSPFPKRIGKGYAIAWATHDAIAQAILKLSQKLSQLPPNSLCNDDLHTLCELSQELNRWQERIRIHRGKPLPGAVRKTAKASNKTWGREKPTPIPQPGTDLPAEWEDADQQVEGDRPDPEQT